MYARIKRTVIGVICSSQLLLCGQAVGSATQQGQPGTAPTKADIAWKAVNSNLPEGAESRIFAFRQRGLAFWDAYPTDARRYDWLRRAIDDEVWVRYCSSLEEGDNAAKTSFQTLQRLPEDSQKREQWDEQRDHMFKQFWNDPNVTDEERCQMWRDKLFFALGAAENVAEINNQKISPHLTQKFQQEIVAFANRFPTFWGVQNPACEFFWNPREFGIDSPAKMMAFTAELEKSRNSYLVDYALGQERIAKLAAKPLELKFTSPDGREVDLAALKGKVVFIDIWSTFCSTCVERMPKTEELYERYRDKGLEVIGICLDGATNDKHAQELVAKGGAKWPNYFMDRSTCDEFAKQYSIEGVPVTLLLDREGKLITSNPDNETLENTFRKALGITDQGSGGR